MLCPGCQSDVLEGARFCIECGTALTSACPNCGAAHGPGQRFCAECGVALAATDNTAGRAAGAVSAPGARAAAPPPEPELRFVSVLFVDLVGFTALSESRDAEDVRDVLGRYFAIARTITERYGGTIEKFIGDAVMAVWGAPVAREDDAERAVRAALEIVDAVAVFGQELDAEQLRARAGVVTGQAAAVENPGEGIVVGDRVNTASRVQAVAEPGAVFVDETTRRVASGAILFEDAGEHVVKGKTEPLHLWRAARVVAGAGGRGRDAGLEAPFSGRDADLRLLKDLFHGALDRGSARLVAISADAGVGKSRLVQELLNYTDGLADLFLWHTGRCLAHGDGVAYWALSEMVRQRLGIQEDAADADVSAKLTAGLEEWVDEAADREFMAPRLGALLGITETALGQAELFAGWRMFFERLAAHEPVVMLFEDMQWADRGLLDFIEQLVDWSAALPIFVIVLARPELASTHNGWPVAQRGATIVQLEALDAAAVRTLVLGLAEELPESAVAQIVERAQGVPLYAIETVRSLVDRQVLVERDGHLELAGEVGELEVPATLNALLSARLDALDGDERAVVKAMSVFGGSFPRSAAAALSELPDDQLDAALAGLVRKQILTVRAEPLSPDRGQYAFAQGLLRTVAYELLSRRERKARHLAAAAHLRRAFANEGEEVAEVIASHHLAAYEAAGTDADAEELRAVTVTALARAAQRAASVGALDVAQRLYTQASELSDDELERATLGEAAAEIALTAGRSAEAVALLEQVAAAHAQAGRERQALHLAKSIGLGLWYLGRGEEALRRLSAAVDALGSDPLLDRDGAELNSVLGRLYAMQGDHERARSRLDVALTAAQALDDSPLLADALSSQAVALQYSGRPQEAAFNFVAAIEVAERDDVPVVLARAQINAGNVHMLWDLPGGRGYLEAALAGSRRRGQRLSESICAANLMYVDLLAGRWDDAERLGNELLEGNEQRPGSQFVNLHFAELTLARGRIVAARSHVAALDDWRDSQDPENVAMYTAIRAALDLAQQRPEDSLTALLPLLAPTIARLSAAHDTIRMGWPVALEAAVSAGRLDDTRTVLGLLSNRPRGLVPPYLHAQLARGRALLAIAAGDVQPELVEAALRDAVARFTALGYPYWLAVVRAELGNWLTGQGRESEAEQLLEAARVELTRLGARPRLDAYFSTRATQAEGSSISARVGSASGAENR
ncbi:MAG: AAA family ATPase [Acidobacteriota bacterium]|nr:AAA family ATPase [Acidobacteriota bacterium]